MVVQTALIVWEAKQRRVELQIERAFNGDELVSRMNGWVTVERSKVIETLFPPCHRPYIQGLSIISTS